MQNFFIYISLPKYLRQWFIYSHLPAAQGSAGEVDAAAVRLIKGSAEMRVLEFCLTARSREIPPRPKAPGEVAVVIPSFKGKPADTFNHLTASGRKALTDCIADRFDLQLWQDLHHFGSIGQKQKNLIYAWMEAHGIDDSPENWDAISKRYQRLRKRYLDGLRKKFAKSKK